MMGLTNFLFILFISTMSLFSQTVSGYLIDEKGEALPGGNIYIDGTNIGIATNKDGYYNLKIQPGKYKMVVSYLGYISDTLSINMKNGENLKRNITLKQSIINLATISVFSDYHNSAEQIVLYTIENKENYISKIKNYVYNAYSKTVFLLKPDSAKEEIGGITEIQSKGYFEVPNNFQEIVLAKRQTANFSELYNVFSSGKILSILDDIVNIDEVSIVSPLNKNALDYYNYKMIDTTFFDSKRIFNISVTPKTNSFPLFEGTISIIDGLFVVINVDLYGKERIKSTMKSDIRIRQLFRQFDNYFWFPVDFYMTYTLDLGFPGVKKLYLRQQSHLTNYVFNNSDFHHKFDDRLYQKADLNTAQSDSVWANSQIVELSREEKNAYRSIDSSMAQKSFLIKFLINLPELYLQIRRLPITELWDFYRFNRVEGNYFGLGVDLHEFDATRLILKSGYGLADKKFKYSISGEHYFGQKIFSVDARAFNKLSFLDPYYEYRKYDITLQQILFNKDYADYYYSKGWSFGIGLNPIQHLNLSANYSDQKTTNAFKNDYWSLFNRNREIRKSVPITEGEFKQLNFSIKYDNRKYYDYSWGSIQNMADDFFRFNFDYTFAPQSLVGNQFSFQQYHIFMNIYTKLPPYMNFNISTILGYLDNSSIVQRNFHLPGSYGSFSNSHLFRSLKRDSYLGDSYACLFIENNFRNTLFNLLSIPFLKNSKFDLYVFGNFGWINNKKWSNGDNLLDNQKYLSEAGFGIGNLFFFMRLDFTWRITPREAKNFYINFGSTLTY